MSGTVLSRRTNAALHALRLSTGVFSCCRSRLAARSPVHVPAVLAALCLSLPAGANAQLVDTGQAQCCSEIAPTPATYYGATMFRKDDPRSLWRPRLAAPLDPPAPLEELLEQVEQLELEGGPMSPALAEPLGWLGAAYLAEDRIPQAIAALNRGIHLARINEGLHTPSQAAMIEQLIAIYVSLGDYVAADEQQTYLYRVKRYRQRHTGNPELHEATLRYADWMRGAYLGDMDRQRFSRLMSLSDLYDEALEELEEEEGEHSPSLLPFLQGRIELSYLVSVYPGERETGFQASAAPRTNFNVASDAQLRFWRLRDHNFRYGLQALERKEEVLAATGAGSEALALARIARADWYQWHLRYADAIRLYEEAWQMLATAENADTLLEREFGAPLELPQETVFNPGVVPLGTLAVAEIRVGFDVSRHGRARSIDVQTEKDSEEMQAAITRTYHYLRNVRFRPRLEDGKVVASEGLTRTYTVKY